MGLIYRAVWHVAADADGVAHERFRSWVRGKHPGLTLLSEGRDQGDSCEAIVTRQAGDAGRIGRWVLREEAKGSRWITTLTVLSPAGEDLSWLWVDLEYVSDEFYRLVDVAAPRLVRDLLQDLPSSARGRERLVAGELKLGPRELDRFVESLRCCDRSVPLVVFSGNRNIRPDTAVARARRAALTLAGVAQVHLLIPDAESAFQQAIGRDLAVWGGAARVYLPRLDLDDPRAGRHRYFPERLFDSREMQAGLVISRYLSPFIARQRAPGCYLGLQHLLDGTTNGAVQELEAELEQIAAEHWRLEQSYLDAAAEVDDLNRQLDQRRQQEVMIWRAIGELGLRDRLSAYLAGVDAGRSGAADIRMREPASCSEAAELAADLLHLELHENACRDLDVLDQAIEGSAWARTAWRGLLALDRYAEVAADFAGGFKEWCEVSHDPLIWPSNSKKLALVESESVRGNERLRSARILPVHPDVDPGEAIFMESHLKIAEGGGPLAPRLYFHDGTMGPTGKVHVGFFGPHHHMPNRRTN